MSEKFFAAIYKFQHTVYNKLNDKMKWSVLKIMNDWNIKTVKLKQGLDYDMLLWLRKNDK